MAKSYDQQILLSLFATLLMTACAAPRSASGSGNSSSVSGTPAPPARTIGHAPSVPVPLPATTAATQQPAAAVPKPTPVVIDPTHLIDKGLLQTTLAYYAKNKSLFTNQNYVGIIDYAKPSSQHRLFIINMHSGEVWGLPVAHGRGSDPSHHGIAKLFSDLFGSNASSLGFFRTADTYEGSHGLSLKLDGLSPSNTHARQRNVVIHGADYVKDGSPVQGRSWGCPAVPMADRDHVINFLKNGSLLYAGLGKMK